LASVGVEAARARVHMDVNGSHANLAVLLATKARDWLGRPYKKFAQSSP
jgi:hypothetical protein